MTFGRLYVQLVAAKDLSVSRQEYVCSEFILDKNHILSGTEGPTEYEAETVNSRPPTSPTSPRTVEYRWEDEWVSFSLPQVEDVKELNKTLGVKVYSCPTRRAEKSTIRGKFSLQLGTLQYNDPKFNWINLLLFDKKNQKWVKTDGSCCLRLLLERPIGEGDRPTGEIEVEIIRGSDLNQRNGGRHMNSVAEVQFAGKTFRSKAVKGTEDPEFLETTTFPVYHQAQMMHVAVFEQPGDTKAMGIASLAINDETAPTGGSKTIYTDLRVRDGENYHTPMEGARPRLGLRLSRPGEGAVARSLPESRPVQKSTPPGRQQCVKLHLKSGRNMKTIDGRAVPAQVSMSVNRDQSWKSGISDATRDPVWNETTELPVPDQVKGEALAIVVSGYPEGPDSEVKPCLGKYRILLDRLVTNREHPVVAELQLMDQVKKEWGPAAPGSVIELGIKPVGFGLPEQEEPKPSSPARDAPGPALVSAPAPAPREPNYLVVVTDRSKGEIMVKPERAVISNKEKEPDAYCEVKLGSQAEKTDSIKNNCKPEWNEALKPFPTNEGDPDMEFSVMDKDLIGSDKMFGASLPLDSIPYGVTRHVIGPSIPDQVNTRDIIATQGTKDREAEREAELEAERRKRELEEAEEARRRQAQEDADRRLKTEEEEAAARRRREEEDERRRKEELEAQRRRDEEEAEKRRQEDAERSRLRMLEMEAEDRRRAEEEADRRKRQELEDEERRMREERLRLEREQEDRRFQEMADAERARRREEEEARRRREEEEGKRKESERQAAWLKRADEEIAAAPAPRSAVSTYAAAPPPTEPTYRATSEGGTNYVELTCNLDSNILHVTPNRAVVTNGNEKNPDTYCEVQVGTQKDSSEVRKNENYPVWSGELKPFVISSNDEMEVAVKDKDFIGSDTMFAAKVPMRSIPLGRSKFYLGPDPPAAYKSGEAIPLESAPRDHPIIPEAVKRGTSPPPAVSPPRKHTPVDTSGYVYRSPGYASSKYENENDEKREPEAAVAAAPPPEVRREVFRSLDDDVHAQRLAKAKEEEEETGRKLRAIEAELGSERAVSPNSQAKLYERFLEEVRRLNNQRTVVEELQQRLTGAPPGVSDDQVGRAGTPSILAALETEQAALQIEKEILRSRSRSPVLPSSGSQQRDATVVPAPPPVPPSVSSSYNGNPSPQRFHTTYSKLDEERSRDITNRAIGDVGRDGLPHYPEAIERYTNSPRSTQDDRAPSGAVATRGSGEIDTSTGSYVPNVQGTPSSMRGTAAVRNYTPGGPSYKEQMMNHWKMQRESGGGGSDAGRVANSPYSLKSTSPTNQYNGTTGRQTELSGMLEDLHRDLDLLEANHNSYQARKGV